MREDDRIRLQHMLDAAQEALSFAKGKTKDEFTSDRMLMLSIIKEIEIIGEAANKISSQIRKKYPSVPWKDIVAMRNRTIHGYYDINADIVWNTFNKDIPPLAAEIKKIIKKDKIPKRRIPASKLA